MMKHDPKNKSCKLNVCDDDNCIPDTHSCSCPTTPESAREGRENELRKAWEKFVSSDDFIRGFGNEKDEVHDEVADWWLNQLTLSRQSWEREVWEKVKKMEKVESPYRLNMGIKNNPPSETTRTNLFRSGYNQALADLKADLKTILSIDEMKT